MAEGIWVSTKVCLDRMCENHPHLKTEETRKILYNSILNISHKIKLAIITKIKKDFEKI